jgi:UDP-N-acetylmuramoyl-L-alanyl-D-glutamate--2,6-diaminopimelate ligase
MPKTFADLLRVAGCEPLRGGQTPIAGVVSDSRAVTPGSCFVAIRGFATDGHQYLAQAVAAGAVAVVYQDEAFADAITPTVPCARALDSRRACAAMSAAFWDVPSARLVIAGVTGTNGKTTTVTLIDALFRGQGFTTGVLGTLGRRVAEEQAKTARTTPDSVELQETFAEMLTRGVTHVTMEVSSHALSLHRVWGTKFDAAVFTNLTQDHLDFYGSLDEYLEAKTLLFSEYADLAKPEKELHGILNADDPSTPLIRSRARCPAITYAVEDGGADVVALSPVFSPEGARFEISAFGEREPVELALAGRFNVYNALGAAACGLSLGLPLRDIARDLATVERVDGRFESVDEGQDFAVLVDYAHTPDGLANVLASARQITRNRLICVFGCGGDRDRTKRPLMGAIAAEKADLAIVTSDNPRSEDPLAIIEDIRAGIAGGEVVVEPDRRRAIGRAISLAAPGDVIVIAGKGHEDYQVFADKTIHFDDRQEARRALKARGATG